MGDALQARCMVQQDLGQSRRVDMAAAPVGGGSATRHDAFDPEQPIEQADRSEPTSAAHGRTGARTLHGIIAAAVEQEQSSTARIGGDAILT